MQISLWSGPRNCSTALMYSFAQRSDTRVVDEPVFAHFLHFTGVHRPSRDEVLATMSIDPDEIRRSWLQHGNKHVFIKHMANHLEGWTLDDFATHRNVILVREPRKVLKSYRAHIDRPTSMDLCYEHQLKWFQYCQARGWSVAVLNSDALIVDPERALRTLCEWLGLRFQPAMMHWTPGPRREDGVWAKYWYQRVHASTGWERPAAPFDPNELVPVAEEFLPLLHEIQPAYEQLCAQSII